jgi:hypothetical protein
MQNQPLLDVLTREGVLISVSVRYWRAAKKLRAEDLGLDPDDVTERLISLGHKKLLPREALAPFAIIESRAHALVEASTFPFLNGLGHFLPNTKLEEVTGRLRELEREFIGAQAAFMRAYAQLRQQASQDWHDAAQKLVTEPERVVATIEASFPAPELMGKYFTFATQLFQIRVPEKLEAELITLGDQQQISAARQRAAQQASTQITAGVDGFVRDCVATLREQTARLCSEMLASMQVGKTEGVHQKTLNRLTKFIEQFQQLNFAGDQDLAAQLEYVRREFLGRTAEEYRDNNRARERLQSGIRQLADTALELAKQDATEIVERFGRMGARRFHLAA